VYLDIIWTKEVYLLNSVLLGWQSQNREGLSFDVQEGTG
jgi:hypothetical protein